MSEIKVDERDHIGTGMRRLGPLLLAFDGVANACSQGQGMTDNFRALRSEFVHLASNAEVFACAA